MKIILILFILISSVSSAQKKDTAKLDTVFVFSVKDVESLKNILMESRVIISGNQLTGKELQQLFQWIDSKGKVFKKEQPK